ncbi:hypothetical protein HPP92_024333 [Vanilla planifolia]|uniref:GTD-binding domain-containing protein n=1 Tax=Vanilla planifolia TaxID=51239 RepID=A0A835PM69_VANPL|nr:hypothetical protein HPP92_024333 [Vanilla planifolia]
MLDLHVSTARHFRSHQYQNLGILKEETRRASSTNTRISPSEMACRAVERWTLSSLVGAYLDLALAYLLLVGATTAYFVSKILYLFSLSLPCCCDGQFGHPACCQTRFLLDLPTSRLAAVHRSLRSRFPLSLSAPLRDAAVERPEIRGKGVRLRRRHRSRAWNSLTDVEESLSSSAGRVLCGPWNSSEDEETEGLFEEATAEEENDPLSVIGGMSGVDEGERLPVTSCLERELEEEREARVALYLELEKERSAAATAADEAMAMIQRVQKEKAEIEMEARQYQRMVEEKSAYDEEEMDILKEIIVRREREKHVLEMEVEMYKQLLYTEEGAEQAFNGDENFVEEKIDTSSDDPMMMLQQIYNSIGKQDKGKVFGAESLPMPNKSGDGSNLGNPIQNFVDTQIEENSITCNSKEYHETVYRKDIADITFKDKREKDTNSLSIPFNGLFAMGSNDADHRDSESSQIDANRESESSQAETEASVHDVHVVNDGQVLEDHRQNNVPPVDEFSFTNLDEMEFNIRRSCSEITNRISLVDALSGRAPYLDLRRSSMISVDNERHKLENEVDFLRKRLKIIRQGREKLGLSAEHREKETFQLQLLDEISCKLKEFKNVAEPIKNRGRVSLLPPSSKSKRRVLEEI